MSSISGFSFGAMNTIVGHPMDTVKTKMQTQGEHLKSGGLGQTIRSVYAREGFIGFYRGCIPPFFGSIIYRSLQFSVFEAFYTFWEKNEKMRSEIPGTGGL